MFTLDIINDSVFISDTNKIILPEEAVNLLNDQWVWEVYFNDIVFDAARIYAEDSEAGSRLIIELSDEMLAQLGWHSGDEVTWAIVNCSEGPEVKIYKF
jgi:hypothetical protein